MAFNLKITTAQKKGINNVSSVTTKINVWIRIHGVKIETPREQKQPTTVEK